MKFGEILPSDLRLEMLSQQIDLTLCLLLSTDGSCCLITTFANGLDPEQTPKCIWPDLYPSISYLFDTTDGVPESCLRNSLFKNMQMTKICKHIQYAKS